MNTKKTKKNTSKNTFKITPENYLRYYYDIPFEGTTSAGKPLRKLRDIPCPYRGIKIIPSEMIKGFEKNLVKCKTAEDAIKLLSCYKKNMLPVEKTMFAIFKDFALLNPDDNLQNCLEMIKTNCLNKLKLEELEVLDDVDMLSRKLSTQTALKLRNKTTKCRQIILSDSKNDTFKRKTFLISLEEIIPKENEREIFNDIKNHNTSLGDNPCFPMEQKYPFDYEIIKDRYKEVVDNVKKDEDIKYDSDSFRRKSKENARICKTL